MKTMIRKRLLTIVSTGILVVGFVPPVSASLIGLVGETVTLDYYSDPNGGAVLLDSIADDTVTVSDPGVELASGDSTNLGGGWLLSGESIDIKDNSIVLTFQDVATFGATITGYSGTVTGISGTVLSAPCTSGAQNCATESGDLFSNLVIAPDGGSFSFVFTAANYTGGSDPGGIGQLNLAFASPVPLPGALLLMLTGLAGLAGVGARKAAA